MQNVNSPLVVKSLNLKPATAVVVGDVLYYGVSVEFSATVLEVKQTKNILTGKVELVRLRIVTDRGLGGLEYYTDNDLVRLTPYN